MNGSRDKKLALAINDEGATIIGDIASQGKGEECEEEEEEETELHFAVSESDVGNNQWRGFNGGGKKGSTSLASVSEKQTECVLL